MSEKKKAVLVTGGSGYTGQFLVHSLATEYEVHYTYGTRMLSSAPNGVIAHKVDLLSGEGLQQAFQETFFHAVINCAAVSQPGSCEAAPHEARAVNVPRHLVESLHRQQSERGLAALLVHFSTDQVYDGTNALWKEDEQCVPVNVYGKTKLEAEHFLLSELPDPYPLVILRCSIIYGPPPPDPVPRTLFLQFVAAAVRGSEPTTFFSDEWRNPVYVRDLERLVKLLITRTAEPTRSVATGEQSTPAAGTGDGTTTPQPGEGGVGQVQLARRIPRVVNTGGPERLSRLDMARQVADCLGCGHDAIRPAPSATMNRPVPSPGDISMDVSRLTTDLGFQPTLFQEALKEVFGPEP